VRGFCIGCKTASLLQSADARHALLAGLRHHDLQHAKLLLQEPCPTNSFAPALMSTAATALPVCWPERRKF